MWLTLGILALLLSGACRRGVPVMDLGARPPDTRGTTLTGIVRGASSVAGRDVQVVNTSTGVRYSALTSDTGGFTIALPAGTYQVELPLRDGETLVKRPGAIDLRRGDLDAPIELVLAAVRVSRPRGPAYRLDNGLGSPIT